MPSDQGFLSNYGAADTPRREVGGESLRSADMRGGSMAGGHYAGANGEGQGPSPCEARHSAPWLAPGGAPACQPTLKSRRRPVIAGRLCPARVSASQRLALTRRGFVPPRRWAVRPTRSGQTQPVSDGATSRARSSRSRAAEFLRYGRISRNISLMWLSTRPDWIDG